MHYYLAKYENREAAFIFKVSYGCITKLHEMNDGPSWDVEEITKSQFESFSPRGLDLLSERILSSEWSATVNRYPINRQVTIRER